jgi:Fe-S-cluster containining protein
MKLIADSLEISVSQLKSDYLKRVGLRMTIIEHDLTKDCIFLRRIDGAKKCMIYSVRPAQCRSWPFWPANLASGKAWNEATRKCPGVNRGRLHTNQEIQKLKRLRKWWQGSSG